MKAGLRAEDTPSTPYRPERNYYAKKPGFLQSGNFGAVFMWLSMCNKDLAFCDLRSAVTTSQSIQENVAESQSAWKDRQRRRIYLFLSSTAATCRSGAFLLSA